MTWRTVGEMADDIEQLKAELAKLREENDNVKRWFREAEGHRDYWKGREQKRTAALEAELAKLREALEEIAAIGRGDGPAQVIARNALKETNG